MVSFFFFPGARRAVFPAATYNFRAGRILYNAYGNSPAA
jgi:hypothetical protein